MLSQRCRQRNEVLIPKLLNDHGAQLYGALEVIDLSTAENQLLMDELIRAVPDSFGNLAPSDFGYSPGVGGSPKVRERIAHLLNTRFRPRIKVEVEHVVLGAGGSFALQALVEQICETGDGILIATPYWPGLDLAIAIHKGAKTVSVQMPLDAIFTPESIRYYEEALRATPESLAVPVKGLLVCNPHNPLGRNYPRETLQATLDFCVRNGIHFISDEVYALSQHSRHPAASSPSSSSSAAPENYEGVDPFVSALELDPGESGSGLVHVLYSLSKDFGCNGLRVGAFISQQNKPICLSGALTTFCQTSTMATLVAERVILTDENVGYVTGKGQLMLKEAYGLVRDFLLHREVDFVPAHCGMFVFARLCHHSAKSAVAYETSAQKEEDEKAEAEAEKRFRLLLKQNGVVLAAGTDYHLDRPGWFRICYGCPRENLLEGLRRIGKCLEEFRRDESDSDDDRNIQG